MPSAPSTNRGAKRQPYRLVGRSLRPPGQTSTARIYTPPCGGLVAQSQFPYNRVDSFSYVKDEITRKGLMNAVAIARRLISCERGIAIMAWNLSAPALAPVTQSNMPPRAPFDPATRVDPAIRSKIYRFLDSQSMTIVIDDHQRVDGRVKERNADQIRISGQLLDDCRRAWATRDLDLYHRHSLFLAIVIAHECQHVVRMTSQGIPFATPENIRSPLNAGRKAGNDPKVYDGEGGWSFEYDFFGGILAPKYTIESRRLFRGQIEGINLSRRQGLVGEEYFAISPAVIARVCEGALGWERTFPLQPSIPSDVMSGPDVNVRRRMTSPGGEEEEAYVMAEERKLWKSRSCGR